ncbi:MAG: GxxExxY protein [Bacteroidetes bacterium]|nr:GxxExxY protein [Bacteroidota bacterium]
MGITKREDLVHPDLSYKIVGAAFTVFNELGEGHLEKIYQRAFALEFKRLGLNYKEQIYCPVVFNKEVIGKNYFDFLVEDQVIVELKRNAYFSKKHMDQITNYLRVSDLRLGLLIGFSTEGVRFKRIVNVR